MEYYVMVEYGYFPIRYVPAVSIIDTYHRLRQVSNLRYFLAGFQASRQFHCHFFAHAVAYYISPAVHQQRGAQFVLPIVIVGHASHGCLDSSRHNRGVGEKVAEYG